MIDANWVARTSREPHILLSGPPLAFVAELKAHLEQEWGAAPPPVSRLAKVAKYVAAFVPLDAEPQVVALIVALKGQIDRERMRDPLLALTLAKLAKYMASALPANSEGKALARWAMGNARYSFSQYNRVLDCYTRAEQWYAERGWLLNVGRLQANRVAILQEKGEFPAALALAGEAHRIFETLEASGDDEARYYLARLGINLVSAYYQLGDMPAALHTYQWVRPVLEALGDHVEGARLDINAANALCDMDRFAEVGVLLETARCTLVGEKLWLEVARADLNLGILAYRLGQYEQARRWLHGARDGFEQVKNLTEVAVVDMYESFLYLQLNLLKESLYLSNRAIKRFKQHDPMLRQLSQALLHQAVAYQRKRTRKGYKQASKSLTQARELLLLQGATSRLALLEVDRAELALSQFELEGEPRWLLKARRLLRQVERELESEAWPNHAARALLLRARCALHSRQPRWQKIERLAEEARQLATRYQLADVAIWAYYLLARVEEQRGSLELALGRCQTAIETIEAIRAQFPLDEFQAGFMDDKLPLYELAVRLSQQLGDVSRVLHYLTLTSLLVLPRTFVPTASVPEKLQALRQEWRWWQSKEALATEGEQKYKRVLEKKMAEAWRRWLVEAPSVPRHGIGSGRERLDPAQAPARVTDLQRRLAPKQGLLHVYGAEGELWAAMVRASGPARIVKLGLLATLEELLASWVGFSNSAFGVSKLPSIFLHLGQSYLRRFYDVLFAPLKSALTGLDELFLVLPPAWHALPVAAFFDGERYVVQDYCLTHLSCADALLAPPGSAASAPRRALVLGYSNEGHLQQAPQEARAVARVLEGKGIEVSLLCEEHATHERVRRGVLASALIHLATHACFRPDNPLFSWLQLADDQLMVSTLYEMALPNSPLVVISGCETGRGAPRGGGLLGMSRGWLEAGASGLVVSLWKVEDHATARLMGSFYSALDLSGPPAHSAARALQAAQCAAIASLDGASAAGMARHPFAWGAFLFVQG